MTVTKTWVVTSANPRPTHDAIDGETIGMNENFSNGLAYPGDQSTGDPGETANCSCVMAIEGSSTASQYTDTLNGLKDHLESSFDRKSGWNGKVVMVGNDPTHAAFFSLQDNSIKITDTVASYSADQQARVLVHEMIHSMSNLYGFDAVPMIEEASTESLTKVYVKEFYGFTPEKSWAYKEQVALMEQARAFTDLSEREYYGQMLSAVKATRSSLMRELAGPENRDAVDKIILQLKGKR